MVSEREWGIVLARGSSHRMGHPKGLCRLPGDDTCFLRRIVELYLGSGRSVSVVTTHELQPLYAPLLADLPSVRWIIGEEGPGTGHTVAAAATALVPPAERFWLHPVDVPGVTPSVVQIIAEKARQHPAAVIVPEYQGRPGHPVVLPKALIAELRRTTPTGSLRTWLLAATGRGQEAELVRVPLDDPVVVTDYDDPASLRGADTTPEGKETS